VLLAVYNLEPPGDLFSKARSAASKAIALDPNLVEAHTSLGRIFSEYDRNAEKAEDEYQQAIRVNPSYATAHHWYALHLLALGRHDEAKAELQKARELDPLSVAIADTSGLRL